jgi:hypothetical protein
MIAISIIFKNIFIDRQLQAAKHAGNNGGISRDSEDKEMPLELTKMQTSDVLFQRWEEKKRHGNASLTLETLFVQIVPGN